MPLKLCIDPGHGGFDPGSIGNGLQEKALTLYVAQRLRDLLTPTGIQVIMTRAVDASPSNWNTELDDLKARCAISNNAYVDWFLSIHFNAFKPNVASGSESYCMAGGKAAKLAPLLVDACAKTFGYHGEKVKDGSKLYVVKNTNASAILLEIAYIDSEKDMRNIKSKMDTVTLDLSNVLIKELGGRVATVTPTIAPTPSAYVTHAELDSALAQFRKDLGV